MKLIALLLILNLISCSTSSVIIDINIAIVAVDIAAPVVAAFGAPAISQYLILAGNGLSCVLTAANSPGATTATIAAAITSCLASVILPNISGLPPNIASVITAVAQAIANIVSKYGAKKGLPIKSIPMNLTWSDRHKVHEMQDHLNKDLVILTTK